MPFIPLIVAAVSIAASAGTIGGLIAGTVALSSLSIGAIAGVVGAVGATIGAVGAITGNKFLKTAGLVIGGIGAVAGLANMVGAFGEGATVGSVFGGEAAAAGDTSTLTGTIGGNISENTGVDIGATAPAEGSVVSTAVQIANTPPVASADYASYLEGAPNVTPGVEQAVVTGTKVADTGLAPAVVGGVGAAAKTVTTTSGAGTGEDVTSKDETKVGNAAEEGTSTSSVNPETGEAYKVGDVQTNAESGITSVWNGTKWELQPAGGFWKSAAGAAAITGGLNMVSGMMDPKTQPEIAQMESVTRANDALTAQRSKIVSNMNAVLPTARALAVTGRPTGLINSPLAARGAA